MFYPLLLNIGSFALPRAPFESGVDAMDSELFTERQHNDLRKHLRLEMQATAYLLDKSQPVH